MMAEEAGMAGIGPDITIEELDALLRDLNGFLDARSGEGGA